MKISIKKIYSLLLLVSVILTNIGINDTYANKNNTEKTKKEFDLKQKYKGEKLKKIKNSIVGKNNYKVVIQSTKTLSELTDQYRGIDPNIKIKSIGEGLFQIKIPKNSGLSFNFKNLENGMLPETIGDDAIVKPEIFETFDNSYLSGEENQNLWYMDKIKANTFQEELQTKEKIKIGILDTGVDYNNEDLRDNYDAILSHSFIDGSASSPVDNNGHGTQVSGIIGAKINGKGIFGVNSHADIVSLRVFDKDGLGTSYDVLEAINYAANNGIRVINMSFGGIGDPNTSEICKAITSAKDKGILTVVSAGNNNVDVSNIVPAGCSDAITVGSVDQEDNKTSFSNYGTGVDVYAPGKDIYTISLNNSYLHVSGTSFSTALVSGLITKELAYDQTISYDTLINNIHKNYNLISSIYIQPAVTASGGTSGTGEVMAYTGGMSDDSQNKGQFKINSTTYPSMGNNGAWDCGRVETATFSNGYSLKHYTLTQDYTKNIGRTELYYNGILKEYQDNVFYANSGVPTFSGNSCYLMSKFNNVTLEDDGTININYNFWTGWAWQNGIMPTKFRIRQKRVSNLTVTNSVFGYAPHFYIKLNVLDNAISTNVNIASQGGFNDTWSWQIATSGGWLWGSIWFWSKGCTITNVRDSETDYLVDYNCSLNMERSGCAVYGPAMSWEEHATGTFSLLKTEYNLCGYDSKFCSEDDYIRYWIFNDKSLGNMSKGPFGDSVPFSDGNGVKSNFSSILDKYSSEYKSWYESLGITSAVINGTDSKFLIDWDSGEYVQKALFQNGTRFNNADGWMVSTRNITDISSDFPAIYWQSHLENTYFTSTDLDWTNYGGDGIALYPIKKKSDNSAIAYIQYPSGNLFCKDIYCIANSGKFLDMNAWGQITPDSKYYFYQNGNDSYKVYKKLVADEGYEEGVKFLDKNAWGQITPDGKYYIYNNPDDGYKPYKKFITDEGTGEGVKFLDFNTWGRFTPDGKYYIYDNQNDGYKPYKKLVADEGIGEGVKFLDTNSWGQITPDGKYYVYQNPNDNFKVYKKGIEEEEGEGMVLLDKNNSWGQVTPDGKYYIYQNGDDNYKIYKKGIDEVGDGVKFLDSSNGGQFTPDGKYYIYPNGNDNYKMYRRLVNEEGTGEGLKFLDSNSWGQFTQNSKYYIYQNQNDNYKVYKKGIDEVGDGVKFIDSSSWGQSTPDSKYYIYQNSRDNYKVYKKSIEKATAFSLLSFTPSNASTGIATNTLIALNFSQPIDKTTVPGNIILKKADGSIVNTWAVDYSDTVVTFRAMVPLDKNAIYAVELKTGLKDIGGNNLGNDSSFSFTTGSEPAQPGQGGTVASTALSPACLLAGYSLAHPECIILNTLIFDTNTQVVLNGSEGGSPAGDPISLPTGEFTYSNTLMHIPGDGLDYDFSLAYKSQAYSNGYVGISWDHSYNIFLRENIDGSITYFDGKFGVYTFVKDADGNFSRLPGIEADLVKTDTNYELRFTNGTIDIFNADLRIASIRDKDNHTLTFTYTGDRLTSMTDTLGHTITYEYYDHGRLKSITDFSGRTVTLTYYSETDEGGSAYDLRSITINNGADPRTISFTYQKDATSEILSHNILTLTDSKGHEYVKNTYDADDRVASQKYGDGTLTYAYETDSNNPRHITKTTATNKRGMKSEFVYDENGNTLSKTLFNGDTPVTTTYTYADNGKIATETKPLGNGVSYQYDTQNRLTEKREKANMTQANNDTNDIVTKYEYATPFSIPTKITDPNGTIITTMLDTKGNITETKVLGVKKADGTTYDVTSTFTYDTDGHLITKTDGIGNQTKYEYSNGRIAKITEGNGDEATTTLFSYDTHGNLTETTDGEGNIKKFTFDQYDRLTSSLSAEGILQSIEYDANNNKTAQKVDLENGKVLKSTSAYDILDQVVENTIGSNSDDQRVTKIVRDANGNITETTDARGLKTQYVYDLLDQVTEKRIITDPNDQTKDIVTKYMYNKNGNITSITGPKGNKTTYAYDGFDRVISSTDANGTVTKYEYDKSGNITATSIADANGTVFVKGATTFNSLGKALTQMVTDLKTNTSKTTTYTYDQNGNVTSTTDPKGNTTQYVYNSHNKIKETIDPVGNKVQLTYDKRGLVTSKTIIGTNAVSLTTSYVYDRDGRLIKETNNQQQSKIYTYNKQNKIIETVDEAGNKTGYTYDVFGNVLTETKYANNKALTTVYTYDSSNNLTSVTDANGNKTAYEYSLLNQRTKEILPDGSTTTYTYDANSNLASYTDPNGTRVMNTYDVLNRLTHRAIAPGTGVIGVTSEDYAYDTLGRLVSGNDNQNNTVAFQYDAFNNLTSEMNNGKTIGYTYDANANLTNLLFPSGKKLDRAYDQTNRLTGITLDGKNIVSYGYNSLTLDTLTLANGAKTTYGYDALLRLKELANIGKEEVRKGKNTTTQDSIINQYTFSYDATSNILSNGHDNYSYDSLNRLMQAGYEPVRDKKNTTESFVYDPMGNRLTSLVTQTKENEKEKNKKDDKTKTDTTSYTSNILNQYTGVDKTKLTYDKNGNLVSNGKFRFAYDYRNRLIKVTNKDGEIKAEFSYDVLGRRVTKTTYDDDDEIKKIIRYTYSNQDAIQEDTYSIRDGKEKLKNTKEYVYGKGIDDILVMILTTTDGKKKMENRYFYQKNQLGSITAITDTNGKVLEEYKYDAFGKAYIRDGKSDNWREFKESKNGNVRLFTGREYDREIGLYYYRARYYSADLGRFISRDPIGMADDINLYGYVNNNPIKYIDSFGLEKTLIINKLNDYLNQYLDNAVVITDQYMSDYLQQMIIETGIYGMTLTGDAYANSTSFINNLFNLNIQDFNVTAYMLDHAVFGNGQDVHIGNNDFIGQELMKTSFYNNAINNAINNSKNGIINYTENGRTFGENENDFANSFGTINYSITGKINADGSTETHFHITDSYIFNDLGDDILVHNNIAWISQQNGLSVTPYTYFVDIYNIIK